MTTTTTVRNGTGAQIGGNGKASARSGVTADENAATAPGQARAMAAETA